MLATANFLEPPELEGGAVIVGVAATVVACVMALSAAAAAAGSVASMASSFPPLSEMPLNWFVNWFLGVSSAV